MTFSATFLDAPPGTAPSLARLAYNRLGFGPLPGAPDFTDMAGLTAYVDAQLNPAAIDDAACEAYVAALDRPGPGGTQLPPLDCSMQALVDYQAQLKAATGKGQFATPASHFLVCASLARSVLSTRQLYEVLVDFWTNHLNTDFSGDYFKYWEDFHVMRQFCLGKFRDMLGASAKSPSMLQYLSNRYSDAASPNENYGRELMELHTLGTTNRIPGDPDFGKPNYSETDVHTVAAAFTGWTNLRNPSLEFLFNTTSAKPRHDAGAKIIYLGGATPIAIPAGGIAQGELILDVLAGDKRTAFMLSRKLCMRLISDTPETFCPAVIADGMQAYLSSKGDIKAMVRAIVLADHPGADFKSSWGQKVKRPFEFMASAWRALGTSANAPKALFFVAGDRELDAVYAQLGQALFECPPPTGYPDFMTAWMNTNQVFGRWTMANIIVRRAFGEEDAVLVAKPVPNAALDAYIGASPGPALGAAQVVDRIIRIVLGRAIEPGHRAALIDYLGASGPPESVTSVNKNIRPLIGALLASSYFQWR